MAEYINSEIENIEFEEIQHGETGQYVADLILRNFEKIKSRMIYLENTIAQLKANGFDGSTIVDNTTKLTASISPTIVYVTKKPVAQVVIATVVVQYGDIILKPGKDNSIDTYSYSYYNQVAYEGEIIANVKHIISDDTLQFQLTIPENAVSDSIFTFTTTFKSKEYSWSFPIVIANEDEGLAGQGIYVSTIFKRSTVKPDKPLGGSYDTGLPSGSTNQGWSDGIPESGEGFLWSSRRKFTSDGLYPQDDEWSTPFKAMDSADIDVCFCYLESGTPNSPTTHGEQNDGLWHNDALSGDNWMAMSIKSNGVWGSWNVFPIVGEKGKDGSNGNYRNTIYKKSSASSVDAPTINDPDKFVDKSDDTVKAYIQQTTPHSSYQNDDKYIERNIGWQDGPTGNGTWWYSVATISGDDNKAIGDFEYDEQGKITGTTYWSNPIVVNAGASGQSVFVSTVFRRWNSITNGPSKPTGGSYSNPVPNGWYDGIPALTDENYSLIYQSHRTFTSDGLSPQESSWSEPSLMADSANFDVCYCKYDKTPGTPKNHGTQVESEEQPYGWHEVGTSEDTWMATSFKSIYGTWSSWTITKIKSENGKNGNYNNYCFKSFKEGDTVESPTFETPNFVEMTESEIKALIKEEYEINEDNDEFLELVNRNSGWHDGPESDNDIWYMSTCVIDGSTNRATGSYKLDSHGHVIYWSDPVQITGLEGSYNKYQYLINQSETICSENDNDWSDTISGAKEKVGIDSTQILHALPTGYYMWMRQKRYHSETKDWDENWEYIRITGEKGSEGTSIQIKSALNSLDELYALASLNNYRTYYGEDKTQDDYDKVKPIDGDCYIIDGTLYTWSNSSDAMECTGATMTFPDKHHFVNCGQFKGESGESVYLHIRYASILHEDSNGNLYPEADDVSETPKDDTRYIGVLADSHKPNTNGVYDEVYSAYTWSKFVGDDGYGYEYVYRLKTNAVPYYVPTEKECVENSGKTFKDDDYIPPTSAGTSGLTEYNEYDEQTTWTDNPTGISDEYPYEFMCTRKKVNGEWQNFVGKASSTNICPLYNYKGKDGKYNETQYKWLDILIMSESEQRNTYDKQQDWETTAPGQGTSGKYLWRRVREVTPAVSSINKPQTGDWSYIRETGEKGATGTGLTTKGTCDSYQDLFAKSNWGEYQNYIDKSATETYYNETIKPNDGDAWIINGEMWIWQESSQDITTSDFDKYGTECPSHKWYNAGSVKGDSGDSVYIHTKWANSAVISSNTLNETIYIVTNDDLTSYFSEHDGEAPGKFIGTYTDNNETDSSEATDYKWGRYTGDDGLDYEIIYTVTSEYSAPDLPIVTDSMLKTGATDGSGLNGKNYQDNDYVPSKGFKVDGKTITDIDWTDDPQQLNEVNKYQWAARRFKENGLWTKWYGSATENNTTKAYFYNNFGESVVDVRTTPSTYVFYKDSDGSITPEEVSVTVSASKDGVLLTIEEVSIPSDIQCNVTTTNDLPANNANLKIKPTGNIKQESFGFDVTVQKTSAETATYKQVFSYSVVSDGEQGEPGSGLTFNYGFDRDIQITEDINGDFDLSWAFSLLKVYENGVDVTDKITDSYNNVGKISITSAQISYSYGSNQVELNDAIKYTTNVEIDNKTVPGIKITEIKDKSITGGTAYAEFKYNGKAYRTPVSWRVTYLKGIYETIEGNVKTTVITDFDSKISDVNGKIETIENTYVKTETATGWTESINTVKETAESALTKSNETSNTVDGFSQKIENAVSTANSATAQCASFSTSIDGITSRVSKTEENISGATTKISELKQTVDGLTLNSEQITENTKKIASLQSTVDGFSSEIYSADLDTNLLPGSDFSRNKSLPIFSTSSSSSDNKSHGTGFISIKDGFNNTFAYKCNMHCGGTSDHCGISVSYKYYSTVDSSYNIQLISGNTYTLSFKYKVLSASSGLTENNKLNTNVALVVSMTHKEAKDSETKLECKYTDKSGNSKSTSIVYYYPHSDEFNYGKPEIGKWYTYSITFEALCNFYEISITNLAANLPTGDYVSLIAKPYLEEGETFTGWKENEQITRGNLLTDADTLSGATNSSYSSGFTIGKYDDYGNNYIEVNEKNNTNYHVLNFNSITQQNTNRTDYTLSFYSKIISGSSSNYSFKIQILCWDDDWNRLDLNDQTFIESSFPYSFDEYDNPNFNAIICSSEWYRYYFHFMSPINTKYITINILPALNVDVCITKPKLEKGVGITDFTADSNDITDYKSYTKSQIKQTSTELSSRIEENEEKFSELKQTSTELSSRIEENEENFSELKQTVDGLTLNSEQITENTKKIASLQSTVDGFSSEIYSADLDTNLLPGSDFSRNKSLPIFTISGNSESHSNYGTGFISIKDGFNNAFAYKCNMHCSNSEENCMISVKYKYDSSVDSSYNIQLISGNTYTLSFKYKVLSASSGLTENNKLKYENALVVSMTHKEAKDSETKLECKYTDKSGNSKSTSIVYYYPHSSNQYDLIKKFNYGRPEIGKWYTYSITFEALCNFYEINITNLASYLDDGDYVSLIAKPYLEEGETFTGWKENEQITRGNLLTNADTLSGATNSSYSSGFTIGKYDDYGNNYILIHNQSTNTCNILMWWNIQVPQNTQTDYTLSFYSKVETNNEEFVVPFFINIVFYDSNKEMIYIDDSLLECSFSFKTSEEGIEPKINNLDWSRHYIHFITPSSASYMDLTIYTQSTDKTYIAKPKLEKGVGVTDFTADSNDITDYKSYAKSQIEQTSNSIKLSVEESVDNKYTQAGLTISGGVVSVNGNFTGNSSGVFEGDVAASSLSVKDTSGNIVLRFTTVDYKLYDALMEAEITDFEEGMPVMQVFYDGATYLTNLTKIEKLTYVHYVALSDPFEFKSIGYVKFLYPDTTPSDYKNYIHIITAEDLLCEKYENGSYKGTVSGKCRVFVSSKTELEYKTDLYERAIKSKNYIKQDKETDTINEIRYNINNTDYLFSEKAFFHIGYKKIHVLTKRLSNEIDTYIYYDCGVISAYQWNEIYYSDGNKVNVINTYYSWFQQTIEYTETDVYKVVQLQKKVFYKQLTGSGVYMTMKNGAMVQENYPNEDVTFYVADYTNSYYTN